MSNTHLFAVEDEALLVRRDSRLLLHPLFDPNHLWMMMEMGRVRMSARTKTQWRGCDATSISSGATNATQRHNQGCSGDQRTVSSGSTSISISFPVSVCIPMVDG